MIIETAKETIIGSGGKSTAFTIQGNSKVYKILSNDLYTNKAVSYTHLTLPTICSV